MRFGAVLLLAVLLMMTAAAPASAADGQLSASIGGADRVVTVTGQLAAWSDSDVLITITDPNGQLEYFNQKKADAQGAFQFKYVTRNQTAGQYVVKAIGSGNGPTLQAVYSYSGNPGNPGNPAVQPGSGDGSAKLAVYYDAIRGEVHAAVSESWLRQALAERQPDEDGVKRVHLAVESVEGAKRYLLSLPSAAFTSYGKDLALFFTTPLGTLSISGDMLNRFILKENDKVQLVIGLHEWSDQEVEARTVVGLRPALDVEVHVNGTVIAWSNSSSPISLTIPYVPSAEEASAPDKLAIRHIDGNGRATPVPSGRYDPTVQGMTFRTGHLSTFAVVYDRTEFGDMKGFSWANSAVESLAAKGIVKGTAAGAFSPGKQVTRADFLVMLTRALEFAAEDGLQAERFPDVPEDAYYANAVSAARSLGIVAGDGAGRFRPADPITRQEMSVLAYRALLHLGKIVPSADGAITPAFTDFNKVSGYAQASVAALAAERLIEGYRGQFNPLDLTTRAEAAVFMLKLYAR